MEHIIQMDIFSFLFENFATVETVTKSLPVVYSNAIFQGIPKQSSFHFSLGIILFSNSSFYFGNVKDNLPNGMGSFIFQDQTMFYGNFEVGQPEGTCIFVSRNEVFIFHLNKSQITGNVVCMNFEKCSVLIIPFDNNESNIKSYSFSEEEFKTVLFETIRAKFINKNKNSNKILNAKKINQIPDKINAGNDLFGFLEDIESGYIYLGSFDNNFVLNGLGILLKKAKSICFGNFKDSKLNGFGVFSDFNYSYTGRFVQGLPNGELVVRGLKSNELISGVYKTGILSDLNKGSEYSNICAFLTKKDAVYYFIGKEFENNLGKFEWINGNLEFDPSIFTNSGNKTSKTFPMPFLDQSSINIVPNILTRIGNTDDSNTKRKNSALINFKNPKNLDDSINKIDETHLLERRVLKNRVQSFSVKNKKIAGLSKLEFEGKKPIKKYKWNETLKNNLNEHHKNLCWNFNDLYRDKQVQVFENFYRNLPSKKVILSKEDF